jgi:hypothetical protein
MNKQILNDRTKRLLTMQGFSAHEVDSNPNILALTKWTPLLCSIFGLIGLFLGSAYYFVILGVLTFVGAFSPYSLYDYLYKYIFRYIFKFGNGVPHGIQRKIGCGIGAVAYIVSGLGFYFDITPMAYIPSCFMIIFAFIAGIFNWCFISTFYALVCGKTLTKCC